MSVLAPAAEFTTYVECPESGDSHDVEATFHNGVMSWPCPDCRTEHREDYEDAADGEDPDLEFLTDFDEDFADVEDDCS